MASCWSNRNGSSKKSSNSGTILSTSARQVWSPVPRHSWRWEGTTGHQAGVIWQVLWSDPGEWVTWPAQPGSYSGKEQGCSKIRGSRLARLRPGARSDHGRDQTGFILGLCQGTSPLPSHPSHQPWGWGWLRGEEDWLLRIRRRGEGCSGRILMLMWKEGGCPELGKYLP